MEFTHKAPKEPFHHKRSEHHRDNLMHHEGRAEHALDNALHHDRQAHGGMKHMLKGRYHESY